MENTWVGLLVPTVALKFAVDGKIFAAGPLTAWTGLPEMARPSPSNSGHSTVERRPGNFHEIPGYLVDLIDMDSDAESGSERINVRPYGICDDTGLREGNCADRALDGRQHPGILIYRIGNRTVASTDI